MALAQFQRELRLISLTFDEIQDIMTNGEVEDVEYHYNRLCESVKKLESFKDNGSRELMDDESNTVGTVRDWIQQRNDDMKEIREMRAKVKRKLQSIEEEQTKQRENKQQLFNVVETATCSNAKVLFVMVPVPSGKPADCSSCMLAVSLP